ncbi:hypothetical protein [Streptomyces sp. NPDC002855]|uniref:hypothetical protein n=1 Tax=Streptomyces sp. NPDC002855 TaxID=3154437 RepID=UPI00333339B1
MSTVDALLAQSLLLRQPHIPSDVVGHDDLDYTRLSEDFLLRDDDGPELGDDRAAQSLTALCEAVVRHCTIEQIADFLTEQVPQRRAAWILGCTLQLAGLDDGARFWWQYAAGADDAPASYCLYLQHLAHGDTHAAALWQRQATQETETAQSGEGTLAFQVLTADTSLTTLLRVLSRLSRFTAHRHTPAAQAVIEYVASAVATGYDRHPDLELPLPGAHFVDRLILAAAAFMPHATSTLQTAELPNRPQPAPAAELSPARSRTQEPERLLVKVTTEDYEGASVRRFFKEAVAVCWEKATAATSADTRMAYYLKRHRTRTALTLTPTPAPTGPAARRHPVAASPFLGFNRS